LARLILEGQKSSFEELPASDQDLSFQILEKIIIDEPYSILKKWPVTHGGNAEP